MIYVHRLIDDINPVPFIKEVWNVSHRIETATWILFQSLRLRMIHQFADNLIGGIPLVERIAIHAGIFGLLTEGRPRSWFMVNYWADRGKYEYQFGQGYFQEQLTQAFQLIYKIFMISAVITCGLGGAILSAYINKDPGGLPYLIKIFSVFQSVMVVAGIPLFIFLPPSDGVFVATYLGMSCIFPHLEKMRSIGNLILK